VDRGVVPAAELADGRGRQNEPALYPENLSSTEVLQALPQQLDTTPVFTWVISQSWRMALYRKPISELRSGKCCMGSHTVTCHSTQV